MDANNSNIFGDDVKNLARKYLPEFSQSIENILAARTALRQSVVTEYAMEEDESDSDDNEGWQRLESFSDSELFSMIKADINSAWQHSLENVGVKSLDELLSVIFRPTTKSVQ